MPSFTQKALHGIKWTTISTVIRSAVAFLRVAILTRFLPKEAFGTIAIATLFMGFTNLFLDMGFSSAIMHKQDITRDEYSSLFWLNILSGVFFTVLLIVSAPFVAVYYKEPILRPVVMLFSLNVIFSSLGRQQLTVRKKKLDFKIIGIVSNVGSITSLFFALLLAYKNAGVYSLVYSSIFSIAFINIFHLVYGLHKDKHITLHFKLKEVKPFFMIGIYQIGSKILDYISREIDIIIISKTFGMEVLGAYSLCKKLVVMLYGIFTPIIMNVLTPLLAEIQHSHQEVKQKFNTIIEIISTTNFPIYFLVALLAPGIIKIVFGAAYVQYHTILSIISVTYGLVTVASAVSSSQIATGRTDLGFYWTIYRILSTTLYLFIGSRISIVGLVFALLIGTILNMYPFWIIQVKKILKIRFWTYIKYQILPLITSIAVAVALKLVVKPDSTFIGMVLTGALFIIIYSLAVYRIAKNNYLVRKIQAIIESTFSKNT